MQNRHKLVILITLILLFGFSAVSFLMYRVSKQSIQESIVLKELPLTADNIYADIQKDLVKTINLSSLMANNSFLIKWAADGEKNERIVKEYLEAARKSSGAFASFFISDKTRNYYSPSADTKKIKEGVESDDWYFRVKNAKEPYKLSVERDARYENRLTIFVDFQVHDSNNQFIGITGLGINYDTAKELLANYEQQFSRKVYFVDAAGNIVLASNSERPMGKSITEVIGIKQVKFDLQDKSIRNYAYELKNNQHYINVRYMPDFKWFLFVEKSESEAISSITKTLYRNLLLCFLITALVVALTHIALKRYHLAVESAAAMDKLTNLPNRNAFDIGINLILEEAERAKTNIGIIMLDLDHFKSINDTFGHIAGDFVLKQTALTLEVVVRGIDFVCRWGGEEFLIAVRDCDKKNLQMLAEKVRVAIATANFNHKEMRIPVTASLGVAVRLPDENIEHLILRADRALYQAKHAGRNQVILAP
jgi:diguanylate cyclase (GGDEF)-like protein